MVHNAIGKLERYDPQRGMLLYSVPAPPDYLVAKQGFETADVQFWDGRRRTPEQNAKIHAIIGDIAFWSGYIPAEAKAWMKYHFMLLTDTDNFSTSTCSVTAARIFINFLIDFAFEWNIPLRDTTVDLIRNTADDAYFYRCLMWKKCCICFDPAEFHHVDSVGMGRNRREIAHLGMEGMALCRKHHDKAHKVGKTQFSKKFHVYDIKADEEICKIFGLNMEE